MAGGFKAMRFSLAITLSLASFALGALIGLLIHPILKARITRQIPSLASSYVDRKEMLQQWPGKAPIAFVGDSHIQRGLWRKMLGRSDISNFGISGEHSADLLKRIDSVEADFYLILIGANDIVAGRSVQETAKNIIQIINRKRSASAIIAVVSIPPMRGHLKQFNQKVKETNDLVRKHSQSAIFIDLWPQLASDGELNPRLTRDDLHLNVEGYRIFAEIVASRLPPK